MTNEAKHTPGACACRATPDPARTGPRAEWHVSFCPMHAAAPDLLAALRDVMRAEMNDGLCWCEPMPSVVTPGRWLHAAPCQSARAAIAQAGGK